MCLLCNGRWDGTTSMIQCLSNKPNEYLHAGVIGELINKLFTKGKDNSFGIVKLIPND
jgi:hypothetical protein